MDKVCKKCGAVYGESVAFCSGCGSQLESKQTATKIENIIFEPEPIETTAENPKEATMKNISKKTMRQGSKALTKKVTIGVSGVIFLLLGLFFWQTFEYSESEDIVSAIENGNYQKATELYQDEIVGNRALEVEVERALEEKIQDMIAQYNVGEIEIEDVQILISTIDKSNIFEDDTVIKSYSLLNVLEQSTESFSLAEELFDGGKYMEAATQYDLVNKNDIHYDTSREKMEESLSLYKVDALAIINDAIENHQYEVAFSVLDVASGALWQDEDIKVAYQNCEMAYEKYTVDTAISNATLLMEMGEFAKAYVGLTNLSTVNGNNLELIAALESCKTAYIDDTVEQAKTIFYENWNYEAAIKFIQLAMLDIPNDAQLELALTEYQSYRPVWVGELVSFQEAGRFSSYSSEITDNLGDTYRNFFSGTPSSFTSSGWGSITYRLDGVYDSLSGCIIINFDDRNIENFGGYIFAADGVELLNTGVLTGSTEPIDFEIDLTGVVELTIRSYARYGIATWNQYSAYLVDTYLTKDFPEHVLDNTN